MDYFSCTAFCNKRKMALEMTTKVLKDSCKRDGLYQTPELNERLFLHYKGFDRISSLENYTGLRVLYLEGNGLRKIQGLTAQTQLRTLYLQENCVEDIEGLEACVSIIKHCSALHNRSNL